MSLLPAFSRRRLLATGAALGAASLAGARPAFAATDTLTFGTALYPPHLKPFENAGNAANTVKILIYRGLMTYDARGNLVPELAQSVALDSPTVYRFVLRPDAVFHNGQPVTSADVKFTIDTILAPASSAFLRREMAQIEKIDVVDPRTVLVTIKEPNAAFLNLMASYHAPIISAASPSADAGIGAGPYTLVSQERGQTVTLRRFARFYKPGRPKIETLKFTTYLEADIRVAALRTGEVDIIQNVPWEAMDALSKDKSVVLDSSPDGAFFYLTFNCKTGPFADARVRRAVGYGVNRQDMVEAVCFGYGRDMDGLPIPGGNPFGDAAALPVFSYDPDRAKGLLKDAGFANGLTANLLVCPTPSGHLPTAEIVQQQLSKIGIKVEMTMAEWGKRLTMGTAGQYEFSVFGTQGIANDPDVVSQFIGTAAPNYSRSFGFSNPKIDALLATGRRELDLEKRLKIYDAIHAEAAVEAPFVGLTWRTQAYAMSTRVKHFKNLPGFLWAYAPMSVEDVELVG